MRYDKHKGKLLLYGALSLSIMCAVFAMSSQDAGASSQLSSGFLGSPLGSFLRRVLPRLSDKGPAYDIRKYAHMFEYGCLGVCAFLFARERLADRERRFLRAALSALCLCFLFACSDEWHQSFVPGRAGQWGDVLLDAGSALLGVLAAAFLTGRRRKAAFPRTHVF